MEDIRRSKLNLIEWFTNDPDFILQVVQDDRLITQREYQKLKAENDPERRIINLLDIIIGKGNSFCEQFIHVLQKDKVKETYPRLIDWLSSTEQAYSGANLNGRQIISADVHATGGSFVICPIFQTDHISSNSSVTIPLNVNSSRNNKSVGNNLPSGSTKEINIKDLEDKVTDKKSFLKQNWANLVQKVTNVEELADQMMGHGLTNEMYSEIITCKTSQEKMRKLLHCSTTTDVASGAKGHSIVSNITVDGGSTVFSPNIQGCNTANISMPVNSNSTPRGWSAKNEVPLAPLRNKNIKGLMDKVTDKKSFVQQNWAKLVQKVKNVEELADQMMGHGLTNEMYSEIMTCKTPEEKMRKLLQYVTVTESCCNHLFEKLCELQYCIMEELIQ